MNRRLVATVAAVGWLFACAGQPTESGGGSSNHPRKNVMIHLTDGYISPATAQVVAGGNVLWANYASEFSVAIVLPSATVAALGCGAPGPQFGEVASGWRSITLRPGDETDVQVPCPLTPGEYPYLVNLGRGTLDLDNPQLQLEGRIVVK